MSFFQLIKILKGHWKVLVGITLAIVLIALVVSLALPKQYVGTASVIVDGRSVDLSDSRGSTQASQQTIIETQVELIRSERVARRVVSLMKLDKQPIWTDEAGGRGSLINFIAQRLLKSLEVVPSRDSFIIGIQFTALSPEFAAAVANAFAQAYIDVNLELKVDPARQTAGWFDEQRQAVSGQLADAQNKLAEFQQLKGILATSEGQIDIENAKLANLSAQLSDLQGQRADSSSRQIQADNLETSPDVQNHPVIGALLGDVSRAEANVKQLESQLGSGHPRLVAAQDELASFKSQLYSEMRKIAKTVGGSNSVNQRRQAQIKAALEEQKSKVLEMKVQTDQVSMLKREVDRAQRALDSIEGQQARATLESRLQQNNVAFVTTAIAPMDAAKPRVFLNVFMSALFGLVLAAAVVLMLEFRCPVLRDAGDVFSALDIPVLAVVSHASFDSGARLKKQAGHPPLVGFNNA